jgi:two-component system response regulator YesN
MNSKTNPTAPAARRYRPAPYHSSQRARDRSAPAKSTFQSHCSLTREIRQYILANLSSRDDRLSIEALAKRFLKSPSALKKIFKADRHIPIHEYIVRKRMQFARQLLRQNELSISEIASITGYAELSNFSRDFKKYFGRSPRGFLKTDDLR